MRQGVPKVVVVVVTAVEEEDKHRIEGFIRNARSAEAQGPRHTTTPPALIILISFSAPLALRH